jgi:hypothetical protein
MNDLVDVLGLQPLLKTCGLDGYAGNFELLYDTATRDKSLAGVASELDVRVRDYCGGLVLPVGPTAYDYLLLTLREKDVIATFNWDPLLLQASARHARLHRLPQLLFLHGSVAVGVCLSCRVKGHAGTSCRQCHNQLTPSRLLYPVANKDYTSDPYIAAEWTSLREALRVAYFVTIFGYRAPESDAAAVRLLQAVWNENEPRTLAEVELIDVRERDEVFATWSPFITRQHWIYCNDVRDSYLSWHPRRSCEALAFATLQLEPWPDDWMPRDGSMTEVVDWVRPLIEEEDALETDGRALSGRGRRSR